MAEACERDDILERQSVQSPLVWADLIMGNHLSISAFCNAPSASGVLLFTWRDLIAEFGKFLTHRCVGQATHCSVIELANNVLWRASGYPKPEPIRDVKTGQTDLVCRWDIRCLNQTAFGQYRIGFDRPAWQLRQNDHRRIDHHVDVTRHQVLHGRRGPAVRWRGQAEPGAGDRLRIVGSVCAPRPSQFRPGVCILRCTVLRLSQALNVVRKWPRPPPLPACAFVAYRA